MLNMQHVPRWGTDPEGFFTVNGQVIGSEKLIPKNGIRTYSGKLVRDGVQFELNPVSGTISQLATNISGLFGTVQKRLATVPGATVSFDGLVEVSEQELQTLSPATRILGCMPSYNFYEDRAITVDPVLYRKRSAGGHIHIGTNDQVFMQNRRDMVPLFDIIVGNTCVLFDRDPGARERRENYGRAGEFRMPNHGLEYRTTSNFWLRDYTLMSMVFSLAHIAYSVAIHTVHGDKTVWNGLASRVNIERVVKAIDQNDADLALRNLKRITPWLRKHLPAEGIPVNSRTIDFIVDASLTPITERFPTQQIIPNWIAGNQVPFNQFVEAL